MTDCLLRQHPSGQISHFLSLVLVSLLSYWLCDVALAGPAVSSSPSGRSAQKGTFITWVKPKAVLCILGCVCSLGDFSKDTLCSWLSFAALTIHAFPEICLVGETATHLAITANKFAFSTPLQSKNPTSLNMITAINDSYSFKTDRP